MLMQLFRALLLFICLCSQAFATEHPRERLYDDRCVLICPVDAPDLPAIDLVRTLPHVKVDTGRSGGVIPYPQLEARGIEHRQRAVFRLDEQCDLCTPQNHGLCATACKRLNHTLVDAA